MTTEQKHTISIPGLPEGWRAVAYREPVEGEYYLMEGIHLHGTGRCEEMLIVEKIKPRRIVLEETEEDNTKTLSAIGVPEYCRQYFDNKALMIRSPKIWRIVEEE